MTAGKREQHGRTVALIGPDGAGKTTLAVALSRASPLPAVRLQMGLYTAERRGATRVPGLGFARRLLRRFLLGRLAAWHRARGRLVVYDRFATDALLALPDGSSRIRRWRRLLLARACPRPDVIALLDAPSTVLAARRDHDEERCRAQRTAYLELVGDPPRMHVLDATRPTEELCAELLVIAFDGSTSTPRLERS